MLFSMCRTAGTFFVRVIRSRMIEFVAFTADICAGLRSISSLPRTGDVPDRGMIPAGTPLRSKNPRRLTPSY